MSVEETLEPKQDVPAGQAPHAVFVPHVLKSHISEKDATFLAALKVAWDDEPEPGFVAPPTLNAYLERYPQGIRQAVESVAIERGIIPIDNDFFDNLARDVVVCFLDFATRNLEDIVEMYITVPPASPGTAPSKHFHAYIRLRVACMMATLLNQ